MHKLDFFITGIPRSGTSLLCRLLHEHDDCVVINEPVEIFSCLQEDLNASSLGDYYQGLRQDIIAGKAVLNKVHAGKLVDDTNQYDERSFYYPEVESHNFLLGTKNTLAYIARLRYLRTIMPQAKIVACVRHPLHTIASWKSSFQHLSSAEVDKFPIGSPNDSLASANYNRDISRVATTVNVVKRRALLWRCLAATLHENKESFLLIRYEDLIQDTASCMNRILQYIVEDDQIWRGKIERPLIISDKTNVLDSDDVRAIKESCASIAEKFGYEI